MRTYLGEFEQLLLFALIQLEEDAYGALLDQRGLVVSRLGDPTPQRGGKRKRYYSIEPEGAELLRRSHAALARMAHGLQPGLELP